jgi:DNA-binding protein HU-beta
MNKADLVNSVAEKTGLTKTMSNQVINAITSSISESLSKGEKVTLVGFGTFTTTNRTARKGRNPKTGEVIDISAKRVARFKSGTGLSNEIN